MVISLCGAGNVLIVIAAGLGRGDGHRTPFVGCNLLPSTIVASPVPFVTVSHRAVAGSAGGRQRQIFTVGCKVEVTVSGACAALVMVAPVIVSTSVPANA